MTPDALMSRPIAQGVIGSASPKSFDIPKTMCPKVISLGQHPRCLPLIDTWCAIAQYFLPTHASSP